MYSYKFPRAALTVDTIVFCKKKEILSLSAENKKDGIFPEVYILLIERGNEPFKGSWALPGGFIEMNETLETACKRELEEETGLVVEQMTQFKTYDTINRDPRGRTISTVYVAQLPEKKLVKGGDDAARAEWFLIDNLPELAFDHQQILNDFFEL